MEKMYRKISFLVKPQALWLQPATLFYKFFVIVAQIFLVNQGDWIYISFRSWSVAKRKWSDNVTKVWVHWPLIDERY